MDRGADRLTSLKKLVLLWMVQRRSEIIELGVVSSAPCLGATAAAVLEIARDLGRQRRSRWDAFLCFFGQLAMLYGLASKALADPCHAEPGFHQSSFGAPD